MLHGLYYITAKNGALKRMPGVTGQDIYVLDSLYKVNNGCPYTRLYALLHDGGYTISYKVLGELLGRSIDKGLITRTPVGHHVLYAITTEGRQLLYSFCVELDRMVSEQVLKYGNGFNVD